MKKLLIATKNPGKLFEFATFFSGLPLKVVSLKDVGITENVEEDGTTYEENSQKKARFYAKKSGLPAVSDDGGIEVDGLDGKPGVYSKRYFGKNGKEPTDEEIIAEMTKLIAALPESKRGATFRTVVTLGLPDGTVYSVTDFVRGVLRKPKLKLLKGYPYRSFFFLPELNKYYHESELTESELTLYNHRYKAVEQLKPIIKKIVINGS